MNHFATAEEIAREAREALSRLLEKPGERFDRLVRLGWINRHGEVTRLLGGDADPEPDSEPAQAAHSRKNGRKTRGVRQPPAHQHVTRGEEEFQTGFKSTADLAEDAMRALRESRESPKEHFARLVRLGWINRQGEVTRLLGGDAEPEPDSEPGQAALAKKEKRRKR